MKFDKSTMLAIALFATVLLHLGGDDCVFAATRQRPKANSRFVDFDKVPTCLKPKTTRAAEADCRKVFDMNSQKDRYGGDNYFIQRCCTIYEYEDCVIEIGIALCDSEQDISDMLSYLMHIVKMQSSIHSHQPLEEACNGYSAHTSDNNFQCAFSETITKLRIIGAIASGSIIFLSAALTLFVFLLRKRKSKLSNNDFECQPISYKNFLLQGKLLEEEHQRFNFLLEVSADGKIGECSKDVGLSGSTSIEASALSVSAGCFKTCQNLDGKATIGNQDKTDQFADTKETEIWSNDLNKRNVDIVKRNFNETNGHIAKVDALSTDQHERLEEPLQVPHWFFELSDNMDAHIVDRNFVEAVRLFKQANEYFNSYKPIHPNKPPNGSNSAGTRSPSSLILDIWAQIKAKTTELVNLLSVELADAPYRSDQTGSLNASRAVKFLVLLDESALAARLFLKQRSELMALLWDKKLSGFEAGFEESRNGTLLPYMRFFTEFHFDFIAKTNLLVFQDLIKNNEIFNSDWFLDSVQTCLKDWTYQQLQVYVKLFVDGVFTPLTSKETRTSCVALALDNCTKLKEVIGDDLPAVVQQKLQEASEAAQLTQQHASCSDPKSHASKSASH